MSAPRYQNTGMQRSDDGQWLKVAELRSAISSVGAAQAIREHCPAAKEGSTVNLIAGLRAAFDAAIGGPPNYLESDYEVVRDATLDHLNPRDEDAAECDIVASAIRSAAAFIAEQPCNCTPEMIEDHEACDRCAVLGRLGDVPEVR